MLEFCVQLVGVVSPARGQVRKHYNAHVETPISSEMIFTIVSLALFTYLGM